MNNLSLNTSKTKVMVCSKGKIRNIPQFKYGTYDLQVVYEYVYLGVKLSYNGKFKEHMLYASAKGTKAMFGLLQKSRMLNLPTDINVQCYCMAVRRGQIMIQKLLNRYILNFVSTFYV